VSEHWQGSAARIDVQQGDPLQPLTARFALVVVAVALVAAITVAAFVVVIVVAVASTFAAGDRSAKPEGTWEVFGPAIVSLSLALVVSFVLAVWGVRFTLRRREGGNRFAALFAWAHGTLLVLGIAELVIGVLSELLGVETAAFALVTIPLVYTLPAALTNLVRWRTLVIVAGVGFAVAALVVAPQLL
jgi:hypothetical protein